MTAINEALTAKGYTRAADVPAVFGRARTIDGIVIHHWGVTGQSHDGVVNFFVNGPGTTSAHFVVSEGRIHCLVSPQDAAWHSGNAVGNATTIGIECRPEATAGDYLTVAELVRYLRAQYGPLPLSPHRQWQSTACPGVWDLARIDALAGTITPQSSTPKESTLSAAEVKKITDAISASEKRIINQINAVLIGGYEWHGKQHYGIGPVVEETQRRLSLDDVDGVNQ
jgi:N-acetylmuramoyl-L-alanine amidase CwlA